jgi:hypothetical protein
MNMWQVSGMTVIRKTVNPTNTKPYFRNSVSSQHMNDFVGRSKKDTPTRPKKGAGKKLVKTALRPKSTLLE